MNPIPWSNICNIAPSTMTTAEQSLEFDLINDIPKYPGGKLTMLETTLDCKIISIYVMLLI